MIQNVNDLQTDAEFLSLLERLSAESAELEQRGGWPERSWNLLADHGVTGWFLPEEYGGTSKPADIRQAAYLEMAAACLTTTFIFTQRNAAVARILLSENEPLKDDLARQLAANDIFATVGISHLTTSRQHVATPVVQAIPAENGWRLNGEIPWVTGAPAADVIVTGGVQPDGMQVLVALETSAEGVQVQAPPGLLALNESQTASVSLKDVEIPAEKLLLGPHENVLAAGGAGGVTTSALALGSAQKSIHGINKEAEKRPDLEPTVSELDQTLSELRTEMLRIINAGVPPSAEERESLRKQSNSLVLRSAQAYLTASKGAGFLAGHPASRAVREAQFFLVWSCPQNVMNAALAEFACPPSV
jgi:alkylation response protein AidB-like acyl-CoA dehydrogenase